MANTSSAKKATRKIARRTVVNKSRRTQMRGSVRLVEEAIASGDRAAALKAFAAAEAELMQAAQPNILHQNSANRKVSPLSPPIPLPWPAAKGGARRADYLPMAQEVWWRKDDDGVRSGERGLCAGLGCLW